MRFAGFVKGRLRRLFVAGLAGAALLVAAAFAAPWGRPAAPVREIRLEARGITWSGGNPTLTARVGERLRITVRNAEPGPVPHDLRLVGPGVRATRLLQPAEEATLEVFLDRPGRYAYGCSVHPGLMDGVIEVQAR